MCCCSATNGQQYDAGPSSLRRVGALLVAIGPKRWLGLACQRGRCRNVVIDVADRCAANAARPAGERS